ncbi:adenine nucleotide alpha hydrolases-like protein [Backusella circina FSU 941]|nr:adenine nucleotide alpha hydrolases-like protein [Backusella circina FSU 941]
MGGEKDSDQASTSSERVTIPLTTEEPVRRAWLSRELEEINHDDEDTSQEQQDAGSTESASTDSDDDEDDDDLATGQNKLKTIMKENEEEAKEDHNEDNGGLDMMAYLSREMTSLLDKQSSEEKEYESAVSNAKTEDDLLGAEDPELLRRTESNRNIPYEEVIVPPSRSNTIHKQNETVHNNLLIFSSNPVVIEDVDRRVVVQYYGAGKSGILPKAFQTRRKPKLYLVACDFSKESLYALEWTMGTMMRDGDELHVATVINREDNPDAVRETGLDQKGELEATSNALLEEAKKILGQMMLFNIKLVAHVNVGRVKDALKILMRESNYTMVICGSRGRSSVRSLIIGSVSTYLVHKSPVPVAVIRRQKKKKKKGSSAPLEPAHSLSESMRTGQLHVDELS